MYLVVDFIFINIITIQIYILKHINTYKLMKQSMTMLKLATIRKITELTSIPNTDAIEKASISGRNVIVKKGQFNVDDFCIHCEVDSQTLMKPKFEFLRESCCENIKDIYSKKQTTHDICLSLDLLDTMKNNSNIIWQPKGTTHHKITITKDEVRVKIGKGLQHELGLLKINVSKILNKVKYTDKTLRGSINFKWDVTFLYPPSKKYHHMVELYKEGSDVAYSLGITKYEPLVQTKFVQV